MNRKWVPRHPDLERYADMMDKIKIFCDQNGITASANYDSYYFELDGKQYRVSNHSIEASNRHAYNGIGERVRDLYHPDGRDGDTIYIHASKTRIMDIYEALFLGHKLDGRGNPIKKGGAGYQIN